MEKRAQGNAQPHCFFKLLVKFPIKKEEEICFFPLLNPLLKLHIESFRVLTLLLAKATFKGVWTS